MKTIRLKIHTSQNQGHQSIESFGEAFQYCLEKNEREVIVSHELSLELVSAHIIDQCNEENVQINEGCINGCYGSSTGEQTQGLTVWLDSSLFESRFIDSEWDEIVNIEQLCNEYGTKLDCDAGSIHNLFEAMGIEPNRNNTYNYMNEDVVDLCHADFHVYSEDDEYETPRIVVIKFHLGGDPRGNYTDEVVYKFEDLDAMCSAIYPRLEIVDENNLEEIKRLKELILGEPADKELLIAELEELMGI